MELGVSDRVALMRATLDAITPQRPLPPADNRTNPRAFQKGDDLPRRAERQTARQTDGQLEWTD